MLTVEVAGVECLDHAHRFGVRVILPCSPLDRVDDSAPGVGLLALAEHRTSRSSGSVGEGMESRPATATSGTRVEEMRTVSSGNVGTP